MTRSDFVRRANALCTEARRRAAPISAALDAGVAEEDAAGVADNLRKADAVAADLLRGLGALTPPPGDEAAAGQYLDLVEERKARIPPMVEAVEAEDISTIEVLVSQHREGNRRASRLADDLGLTECDPSGLPAAG